MTTVSPNQCNLCSHSQNFIIRTSCGHNYCPSCVEKCIENNTHQNCSVCQSVLEHDLAVLLTNYLSNPVNKLSHCFGIEINDVVWYYKGRNHNWLYSKEHCRQIDDAFVSNTDGDGSSTIEIDITLGNQTEKYIIDFDDLKQYPQNDPNKKRSISCFKFTKLSDLKNHKIVGVAGKYL